MAGHQSAGHGKMLMTGWERLFDLIHDRSAEVIVDGKSLRLAKVVAVARSENVSHSHNAYQTPQMESEPSANMICPSTESANLDDRR